MTDINIADFVLKKIPNYDIDKRKYQLQPQDDIKTEVEVEQIHKYCNTILHIYPINPSFPCFFPQFINSQKYTQLINYIIPSGCIKTSDKSYSSMLSSNNININNPIITIITFSKIYPGLIIGGGQYNLAKPTYVFGGNNIKFMEYQPDISRHVWINSYHVSICISGHILFELSSM